MDPSTMELAFLGKVLEGDEKTLSELGLVGPECDVSLTDTNSSSLVRSLIVVRILLCVLCERMDDYLVLRLRD
jgi:hypothetical protein